MTADNDNTPTPVINLLKDKQSTFAHLCKKARTIQEIDHNLKKLLDDSLSDHFQLANINTDTNTAILSADTSSWATRLRYNIPAILNALNKQLKLTSIKTVRIKVKKPDPFPTNSHIKPARLSKHSAQFLDEASNHFDDPEISDCFVRLSKNQVE